MAKLQTQAQRLRSREDAATMVEYTLMMVFIAIACIAAVSRLGASLVAATNTFVQFFR